MTSQCGRLKQKQIPMQTLNLLAVYCRREWTGSKAYSGKRNLHVPLPKRKPWNILSRRKLSIEWKRARIEQIRLKRFRRRKSRKSWRNWRSQMRSFLTISTHQIPSSFKAHLYPHSRFKTCTEEESMERSRLDQEIPVVRCMIASVITTEQLISKTDSIMKCILRHMRRQANLMKMNWQWQKMVSSDF